MSNQKNSDNNENNIYINGKQQVVELLRYMETSEKTKLLRNLKGRNPTLAKELSEQCFSFENIWGLNDEDLSKVLSGVKSVILGLALNQSSIKNQKRSLSLIARDQAIKAYEVMTKDLSDNRRECMRAQEKILEYALELNRKQIIRFY
jgi:flagellar motor switch protein FliG